MPKEIHEYPTIKMAQKKHISMKKMYGYKPEIFGVTGHGKHFFAVIEPKGLVRIDKRQK